MMDTTKIHRFNHTGEVLSTAIFSRKDWQTDRTPMYKGFAGRSRLSETAED